MNQPTLAQRASVSLSDAFRHFAAVFSVAFQGGETSAVSRERRGYKQTPTTGNRLVANNLHYMGHEYRYVFERGKKSLDVLKSEISAV